MVDLTVDILTSALREIEFYEEYLPWVLVCTDGLSGTVTFSGPFPTRADSERIRDHERSSAGTDSTLTFAVAPLYPALELSGPAPELTASQRDCTTDPS